MSSDSVIHDIGYRHYDGPRLGERAIWLALFDETLRGAYGLGRAARSKVVPVLCLIAISLPAVVMVAVTSITQSNELPVAYHEYALRLQPVIAVFVAAQAPVTVSRDLRFGTVPLYFSRPIRRRDYVSAKLAAFATAVAVLVAVPLTVLFAGALLAELPLTDELPGYLRGLAQAALLAVVLASIAVTVAAFTPRRGTGVAAVVTVLLISAGAQAVVQNVAADEGRYDVAQWSHVLSPFALVDGVGNGFLGTEGVDLTAPTTAQAVVFLAVTAALVVAAWWLLVSRYRRVRS